MSWLPKLEADERKALHHCLTKTVRTELERRHWGTQANRERRFYIGDVRGLFQAAGTIRYELDKLDTGVLYRGQASNWNIVPSLFRGAANKDERRDRCHWLEDCLEAIAAKFDHAGTPDSREALAQHYGFPTRWLDVVDSLHSAMWFASRTEPGPKRDASVGYLYLIAHGERHGLRALDLRRKASEWIRPHIQQAWSVRADDPLSSNGELGEYVVSTFIVPKVLLASWSAASVYTEDLMFPNSEEDAGYRYWQEAAASLQGSGLLPRDWAKQNRLEPA